MRVLVILRDRNVQSKRTPHQTQRCPASKYQSDPSASPAEKCLRFPDEFSNHDDSEDDDHSRQKKLLCKIHGSISYGVFPVCVDANNAGSLSLAIVYKTIVSMAATTALI